MMNLLLTVLALACGAFAKEAGQPHLETKKGHVIVHTGGADTNLTDTMSGSKATTLFEQQERKTAEKIRRSEGDVASLMKQLAAGDRALANATAESASAITAAIDTVVKEMQQAAGAAKGGAVLAKGVTLPTWFAVFPMTTKPGGSIVLGPHGAETLMFSGNGVKDFALETTVWHSTLVTCNFATSDGKKLTSPTRIVSQQEDDGSFAECSNYVKCGANNLGLACDAPAMKSGTTATVTLMWNGAVQSELAFQGAKGSNKVYVASFLKTLKLETVGTRDFPVARGIGFGPRASYTCVYTPINEAKPQVTLKAKFVDARTLYCDTVMATDAKNPFYAALVKNSNYNVQVVMQVTVGGSTTNVPVEQPKGLPGSSTKVPPLAFKLATMQCSNGVKDALEIGVDCGKTGCGKVCAKPQDLPEKAKCDQDQDCASQSCEKGVCSFLPASCTELWKFYQKKGKTMNSGIHKIFLDKNGYDLDKIEMDNTGFSVYCDVAYDKSNNVAGAWTLVQMIRNDERHGTPYDQYNRDSDIGNGPVQWQNKQWNYAYRIARNKWNSIFKHSAGMINTRYANNEAGFHVTDVFGHPETGKHILDQKCSQKSTFETAMAFRPRPKSSTGFCFNQGKVQQTNNCVCGDQVSTSAITFNKCPGQNGNWRRYNSYRSDNRWCPRMHPKCFPGQHHGNLGDTYGCDKPGQRTIQGHFWWIYNRGRYGGGMPKRSYWGYGSYGSRWIR